MVKIIQGAIHSELYLFKVIWGGEDLRDSPHIEICNKVNFFFITVIQFGFHILIFSPRNHV